MLPRATAARANELVANLRAELHGVLLALLRELQAETEARGAGSPRRARRR